MTTVTVVKFQFRKDTDTNWLSSTVKLDEGEPGFDTTNNILKIGPRGGALWKDIDSISSKLDIPTASSDILGGVRIDGKSIAIDNDGIISVVIAKQTSNVAIGISAGDTNQGANAIAIGTDAGITNQTENSIILNATGKPLNYTDADPAFIVKPIRSVSKVPRDFSPLYWNSLTGEIVVIASNDLSNGEIVQVIP